MEPSAHVPNTEPAAKWQQRVGVSGSEVSAIASNYLREEQKTWAEKLHGGLSPTTKAVIARSVANVVMVFFSSDLAHGIGRILPAKQKDLFDYSLRLMDKHPEAFKQMRDASKNMMAPGWENKDPAEQAVDMMRGLGNNARLLAANLGGSFVITQGLNHLMGQSGKTSRNLAIAQGVDTFTQLGAMIAMPSVPALAKQTAKLRGSAQEAIVEGAKKIEGLPVIRDTKFLRNLVARYHTQEESAHQAMNFVNQRIPDLLGFTAGMGTLAALQAGGKGTTR